MSLSLLCSFFPLAHFFFAHFWCVRFIALMVSSFDSNDLWMEIEASVLIFSLAMLCLVSAFCLAKLFLIHIQIRIEKDRRTLNKMIMRFDLIWCKKDGETSARAIALRIIQGAGIILYNWCSICAYAVNFVQYTHTTSIRYQRASNKI